MDQIGSNRRSANATVITCDHISRLRRAPADRVNARAVHSNAGSVPEGGGAGRIGADEITLDGIRPADDEDADVVIA